jgi:hypothetical protein
VGFVDFTTKVAVLSMTAVRTRFREGIWVREGAMKPTFDIRRRQYDTTRRKLENIFFERDVVNEHMAVRIVLRRHDGWVCVDRHFTVVVEA